MKKYFEVLRSCPLFMDIADENLIAMLSCLGARVCHYEKGSIVISEGEAAKYVGIVLSGAVQIIRMDYYGNKSILTTIEPSEIFGESFACADTAEIPINVVAEADTEVMLIDCKRITKSCSNACEFHNRIIFNLLKIVAMKNISFNRKIEITSKRTTREKLMTYLLLEAKKNNSQSFVIPYDRQSLADFLEVDRSGLSAEISKLRSEGVIECKRSHFKLL